MAIESGPLPTSSVGSRGADPDPEDGRSFLIRLTPNGKRLLDRARPAFRDYAEAIERRLGRKRVTALRTALIELRDAIDEELDARGLAAGEARDLDERSN